MKKEPHLVFTPRAHQVNPDMYVRRAALEERLMDAFVSNKFIVIHGESGNGKTWLYKKVFADNKIHFEVLNLGQVAVAGSLGAAFSHKLGEWGYKEKTGEGTNSSGGAKPMGIGLEHGLTSSTTYATKSPFLALLEQSRRRAGNDARAALILDNFEAVVDSPAYVREIAGLILSADDESVAQYNIQIIIVGVPNNLKETIVQLSNSAPVSNRLVEIPEVARMSADEASELIQRGLLDEIGLSLDEEINNEDLVKEISWSTDRIAQHLHELCLLIGQNAVRNGDIINKEVVNKSIQTWVDDTLSSDLAAIQAAMNARDTRIGRKNQTLYALGQCKLEDFKYTDIEDIVVNNFDTEGATLNISQILSGFASEGNPIIRRNPKADAWRFVSPKYRMAIRAKVVKDDDGKAVLKS